MTALKQQGKILLLIIFTFLCIVKKYKLDKVLKYHVFDKFLCIKWNVKFVTLIVTFDFENVPYSVILMGQVY
jgi:hypothetical protein